MRPAALVLIVVALAAVSGRNALAQASADRDVVIGALPIPDLDEDAPPRAFLQAARQSLASGRLGEAVEALERAESRALARDVRPSLAGQPSDQPLVKTISEARTALAADERMKALALIDAAIGQASK